MAAETFRWPRLTIGTLGISLVFFGGASVACVIGQAMGTPVPLAVILIFLAFALLEAWALWASLERVETDATGITWKRPGLKSRHLDWTEICRGGVHERPVWGALELQDEAGRRRIALSYILVNFPRLRALVFTNVPQLGASAATARQTSLPTTFRRGMSPYIFLGSGCLFFLGLGVAASQSELLAAVCLWASGLLILGILVWSWHSLTVDHDRIILHALIRRREIPLADVTATKIEDIAIRMYGIPSGGQINLVLDLKEGKSLKLGCFKDQTLFARELIESTRKAQSCGTR
jgi:hypothetical protein